MNYIIRKLIKHPATKKSMRRIFITGKGWYAWNSIYKVYNANANYEQLTTSDLDNIDFTQSFK